MKVLYTITLLVLSLTIFSQKGKNGSLSVSTANVKINEFTALTANANAGNTTINVAASSLNANARFTSTLTAGDLVMVIQMQGAYGKTAWPPNQSWIRDSTYGYVWDYANCGNYEFAQVKTVISATQIELECGLKYNYSAAGKTQIVRIPRYNSLTVTNTGTLTTDAWNGTIGGILTAEVDGNTTINGAVTASGLGFRGGAAIGNSGTGDLSFYSNDPSKGALKGEGIASSRLISTLSNTTTVSDSLSNQCKGAPANGGGGGDANNCGGGGGANGGVVANYIGYGIANTSYSVAFNLEWAGRASAISSGGGKGGYGTSTVVANPNLIGPNNTAWSSSYKRPSYGGFGGRPLDYSTGKLFMGGGGGAGHMSVGQSNGTNACSGGNGGGLIYLLNYGTISGTGTISSDGANGNNAFGTANFLYPQQGIDGAGGAGAGGTIILKSNGVISGITTNAIGGSGGNQIKSGTTNNEGQGPGGGGSGGYIAASNAGFTQNVTGGVNGTTNATAFDTEFPMNGATSGDVGTSGQSITPSFSITASANQNLCINQSAIVSASSTDPSATIFWYNAAAGGNSIASGTTYTTPVYASTGTYTVYAGSCPGIYRVPIIINVTNGPTFSINSPTICSGQTAVLTVTTSATSYTWSSAGSPTTTAISVSPSSSSIYTINGSSGGSCIGSQTVQVTVNTTPILTASSQTICAGQIATFTVSGASSSYTWNPGAFVGNTFTISSASSTTVSVTGANGTCSAQITPSVTVTPNPTVAVINQTICPTQTITLTASNAATYSWNTGATTNTISVSPASTTIYTVVGTTSLCSNTKTVSVTVATQPTVSVSSQTICPTQTITLTANGATTFSWNTGATTNTISASPSSTTIYTVIGTTSSCSDTKTVSVTVATQPTLAITGNTTICSGSSTTLTASGSASSYTWQAGAIVNSSISVNPNTTTTYTLTGSNGTCTNSITSTVSVTSTPTITGVANTTICPTQTATFTAGGALTFTWSPGSSISSTYTIAPTSNTVISVIGANGTCTSSATANITIGSNVSIAVGGATICPSQSATLTASALNSYTWSTGSHANSIVVTPTSTTTYTVDGTQGSCTGTQTVQVTIIAQPTLAISGNTTICSGSTTTLTASGTASSYTWQAGSVTSNTIAVTPNTTTTYTIIGGNGVCSNSITTTVSVTATPTITGVNNTTICSTQTASFTASGAQNYTWTPGNVAGNTYTIAPTSNTVISVIGSNGNCTSQTNASITISPNVPISVSGATIICPNQSATLTASTVDSYTWSTGVHTNSISVNPSSTTIYTVNGSLGLCSGSQTVQVTVAPIPTLAITGNTAICSGNSTTLTANGSATSFTWQAGSVVNNTISVNPSITTNYTLTGSDGICSNSIITTVSVTATPTITGVSDIIVCNNQTATYTANGATNYTWTPGNFNGTTFTISPTTNTIVSVIGANGTCTSQVTSSITIVTGIPLSVNNSTICAGQTATLTASGASTYTWNTTATTSTITVSPNSMSVYTVNGTGGSCNGTATATVFVNALPTLTTNISHICSGQTATISVNGASTYTWSNGVNGNSQTVSPNTTTSYSVLGTDINGCVNSSISEATVNVTPTPTVSINSSSLCVGQTATLTATGAPSFVWSTFETTQTINPSPITTTTYAVIGSDNGCVGGYTTTVIVDHTTLSTYSLATSSCPSQTVGLFGAGTNSATTTYTWSNGVQSYSQTVAPINTTTYVVNGSSLSGCPAVSGTVVVNVNAISANFSGINSLIMSVGETLNLTDNSIGATSILWSYCSGTSSNSQITIPLSDTGSCCIKLVAMNSVCKDSVTKCISIITDATVVIPNVFTPNGDNKNEFFKVTSSGLKTLSCSIYDRWGLKMYEWDGINGSWDGNTKTGAAPDGTYFYIIHYTDQKDKSTTEKGYLNLFKN